MSLYERVQTLAVFKDLYDDPVISSFFGLLELTFTQADVLAVKKAYANFIAGLYGAYQTDWTGYITGKVLSLETCCTHFAAQDNEIPRYMLDACMNELQTLSEVAALSPEYFFDDPHMPKWTAYSVDLQGEYLNRLINIGKHGYGVYADYSVFRMIKTDEGYTLQPVAHPDPVTFNDLYGYEMQHQAVIDNTKALIDGLPASNILLYGDAGTGKSATVKATVNLLKDDGVRLIEISKKHLRALPALLDGLSGNPLKFIIYIDDLSFQDNDDDFSALKAVLEGSVAARSQNTVIYATSNRRHIVKETFSAREGDDVHRNDTMQETISLSERFGIKILFEKPNLDQYQEIVLGLAKQAGLDEDEEELLERAERFAHRKSGRSARAARQFIEQEYVTEKEK